MGRNFGVSGTMTIGIAIILFISAFAGYFRRAMASTVLVDKLLFGYYAQIVSLIASIFGFIFIWYFIIRPLKNVERNMDGLCRGKTEISKIGPAAREISELSPAMERLATSMKIAESMGSKISVDVKVLEKAASDNKRKLGITSITILLILGYFISSTTPPVLFMMFTSVEGALFGLLAMGFGLVFLVITYFIAQKILVKPLCDMLDAIEKASRSVKPEPILVNGPKEVRVTISKVNALMAEFNTFGNE